MPLTVSSDVIGLFCATVLRLGCVLLCLGSGLDCVHEIMDEEIIGDNPPRSSFGTVMTTSHLEPQFRRLSSFFYRTPVRTRLLAQIANRRCLFPSASRSRISEIEAQVSARIEGHRGGPSGCSSMRFALRKELIDERFTTSMTPGAVSARLMIRWETATNTATTPTTKC